MKKKSITISDVAEKTGYSKTTVSFAFNWPNRVSAETVEKILKCAKEMGYKGSGDSYGSDAETRYKTICILVPETSVPAGKAPSWAIPTMCIYNFCQQNGFMLSLINEGHINDVFFAKYSAVDAFLLFGKGEKEINPSFLEISRKRHIPLLSINTNTEEVSETNYREVMERRTLESAQMLFDAVAGREFQPSESQDCCIFRQF